MNTAPDALQRYYFALGTAAFLVCRNCGIYLAAAMATDSGTFATVNINNLVPPVPECPHPTTVSYETESREERIARRMERWTPVAGSI